jgi:hypothetical protein
MRGNSMRSAVLVLVGLLAAQAAFADTHSYSGALGSPEDEQIFTVTLASGGVLGLQTFGFGGGVNAANEVIAPGGFDPFVGVFAGTGDSATFVDGTSDVLTNYTGGCPPAGTVDIGGQVCGDVTLSETLAAGTYTILLTDGEYIPTAVFENDGTLGDGFVDFTGGVFQTCEGDAPTCITPDANWALDVTTPDTVSPVPEPGGLWALGLALLIISACGRNGRNAFKSI